MSSNAEGSADGLPHLVSEQGIQQLVLPLCCWRIPSASFVSRRDKALHPREAPLQVSGFLMASCSSLGQLHVVLCEFFCFPPQVPAKENSLEFRPMPGVSFAPGFTSPQGFLLHCQPLLPARVRSCVLAFSRPDGMAPAAARANDPSIRAPSRDPGLFGARSQGSQGLGPVVANLHRKSTDGRQICCRLPVRWGLMFTASSRCGAGRAAATDSATGGPTRSSTAASPLPVVACRLPARHGSSSANQGPRRPFLAGRKNRTKLHRQKGRGAHRGGTQGASAASTVPGTTGSAGTSAGHLTPSGSRSRPRQPIGHRPGEKLPSARPRRAP